MTKPLLSPHGNEGPGRDWDIDVEEAGRGPWPA